MNILYECDLAGSRKHGMAHRIYQFSEMFIKEGHRVMIVAASYSHARTINPNVISQITKEAIEGIEYRWIKTPKYEGNGIKRVIHMFTYNFKLWLYANKFAKEFKPDIVISSGVTSLDFIGCRRIANKSKAKIILEVGDLWPLTPIELGGFSTKHPFIKVLQLAENYAYKNTDALVSLLPCAKEYMAEHGLHPDKFNYIPNGVVENDWVERNADLPEEVNALINNLRKNNNILVGYTGTHSVSNSLYTLLDVAENVSDKQIHFILVGKGQIKEDLIRIVKEKKITNVHFLSPIPKKLIPSFLNRMDFLYTGFQKQSLYRFGISPNKIYDYMMAKKPIIQAINAGNNLVEEANCGLYAEPENVDEIAKAILKIKNMSDDEREKLGNNGYEFVMKNHTYTILSKRFLTIMENLIKQ